MDSLVLVMAYPAYPWEWSTSTHWTGFDRRRQDASALDVELWSIFGIPSASAAEAAGPEAEAHLGRCLAMRLAVDIA